MPGELAREKEPNRTTVRNIKLAILLFFSAVFGTSALGQSAAPHGVKHDGFGESLRFASAKESPNVAPPTSETSPDIEGHERILFVVPAFGLTNRQNAPALTSTQKLSLAARQVFDPFVWISTGIQSGISQAHNEFPQYGQGAAGYTRRYGAAMLDAVHSGFASSAFCVLLKEDPRYFRLGQGSIKHRIFYSLSQQFSAKGDNGKRQFNWANVLGTFASGAISNAYYPRPNRGFGLTINRSVISLAWGFTGELAEEFWPDVKRKLASHKVEKLGEQ